MSKSILQDIKECYITGSQRNLHKHHIFYGTAKRKKSDEWGCWVWLTGEMHNQSDMAVHANHDFDLRLKRDCQKRFEELHGHDKFMEVFRRNYL